MLGARRSSRASKRGRYTGLRRVGARKGLVKMRRKLRSDRSANERGEGEFMVPIQQVENGEKKGRLEAEYPSWIQKASKNKIIRCHRIRPGSLLCFTVPA